MAKILSRSTIFCDASTFRIVAAVLENHPDLAAVDAAGGINFLDGHFHAVGNRHAPDLDRPRQVLVSTDHDLGRRDAFIGNLGLGCGRQMGQREGAHRKAQRLERFRHSSLLSVGPS
jgi:hypothetical protein